MVSLIMNAYIGATSVTPNGDISGIPLRAGVKQGRPLTLILFNYVKLPNEASDAATILGMAFRPDKYTSLIGCGWSSYRAYGADGLHH